MDEGPSSSKRVNYGDPDYDNVLQKWFEEIGSDNSDIESECDESFAIESDHDTESEFEGKKYFQMLQNFVFTQIFFYYR